MKTVVMFSGAARPSTQTAPPAEFLGRLLTR